MCLATQGRLQGWVAKLLRARRKSWCNEGLGQFALQLTARWLGLVADRVRVGMSFCTVPVDEQDFGVTIKLSR